MEDFTSRGLRDQVWLQFVPGQSALSKFHWGSSEAKDGKLGFHGKMGKSKPFFPPCLKEGVKTYDILGETASNIQNL